MQSSNTTKMSLSEATKPLLVVSRLVGMNPKSHWHKIHTVVILVCEILVIRYVWIYYIGQKNKNYYFNLLAHTLEETCRITSLLVILGQSMFDRNRYMVSLEDLANIDGTLHSLGGYIDNGRTYRFQILLVIHIGLMILLFCLVKFSFYILPKSCEREIEIMVWRCSYYLAALIVCAVADCSFASILSIIRRRYKEINSIIYRVKNHGLYSSVNLIEIPRSRVDKHVLVRLRILRRQYHNLWRIANRVNETYGLHLLMSAMTSLALIVNHLWTSYLAFMSSDKVESQTTVDGIIWASFYVTRMFFLAKACVSTIAEAKITSVMLQELEMSRDHAVETKSEIRDFLTQLQLEVLKFTACGFFNIDFALICGILGAAFTYLVIFIQMSESKSCVDTSHDHASKNFSFANNNH